MQMTGIVTTATAPAVSALARERGWEPSSSIRVVQPAEGATALEEAARTPADLLLLDVAAATGAAVLRYRMARPDTRVILLAPERKPGDPLTAQVVQAQVYDVVTDLQALGQAIDHPADLAAAARWLDPSLAPGAPQAATRVVERIIQTPMTSHPVTIGLCGLLPGAGTTTTMAAIAGYLARQGHPVLLAETVKEGRFPALHFLGKAMPPGVQWVVSTPEGIAQAAQQHQWRYILVDAGAVQIGGPDEQGNYADLRGNLYHPSAWPQWPLRPDRVVVVIPGAPWRALPAVRELMRSLPQDTSPDALGIVWAVAGWAPTLNAQYADFAELANYEASLLYCLLGHYSDPQLNVDDGRRRYGGKYYDPAVIPVPDLHQHLAWPPGYKQPDPQLDRSVVALLDGLLPNPKIGGRRR